MYLCTYLLTYLFNLLYLLTYLRTYLFIYLLAYLLTYLLMPSDKHNLRTARAKDLISSLINVALSRDVPFHQLQQQQLQCLHHGATFVPLWSLILSLQPRKVTICSRHVMASVRDIQIAEALLTLCLAYYVMKRVGHCWNWGIGFHVSRYGVRVSRVYSPYFP